MSFLRSLFGGGDSSDATSDLIAQLMQGRGDIQKATERGLGLLSPFQQAGVGAIGDLQALLAQERDPVAFLNQIQSQFQQSPAQKFAQQQALQATQNQLQAQGLGGSGAAAQRAAELAANIGGQQEQQFTQNVMGIQNQRLGGLQNLFGGGLSAAGTGAGLLGQEGQSLAGLASQIGQAQAAGDLAQQNQRSGLLGGLFGGLGSGLLGGLGMIPGISSGAGGFGLGALLGLL